MEAFVKGLKVNSFSESLVRNLATFLAKIRIRASKHIEVDDIMRSKRHLEKHTMSKARPRETHRQSCEDITPRHTDCRFAPYVAHASTARRNRKTNVSQKQSLQGKSNAQIFSNKDIAKQLRWPEATNRILG